MFLVTVFEFTCILSDKRMANILGCHVRSVFWIHYIIWACFLKKITLFGYSMSFDEKFNVFKFKVTIDTEEFTVFL